MTKFQAIAIGGDSMSNEKHVWYVAYGSNLSRERFMIYIKGGHFRTNDYPPCADITPPIKEYRCYVPHERYYAKESKNWGHQGVAFLDVVKGSGHTLCRAYLITEEQFKHIQNAEGPWYSYPLRLGSIEGNEAITFTGEDRYKEVQPHEDYLKKIEEGELQTLMLPLTTIE